MPKRKTTSSKTRSSAIIQQLNSVQRAVIEAPDGPILVLAGAGSGKTKVLTHRIAYLISKRKVNPHNILAVTFTNKAANEMKSRLQDLIVKDFKALWVGTFHSICARILRRESVYIGYGHNFVIYDVDDQVKVIKNLMNNLNISQKEFSPTAIHSRISHLKTNMLSPEEFSKQAENRFDEAVSRIYGYYQGFLKSNNAMDFDDLIILPVVLFRNFPQVLERYQERFLYILVDEFQDTNRVQNELIKLLGSKHRNVFVVGDDDQSIYRWRGAELRNILNFEHEFRECQVFRLEQNYRSTKTILDAAFCVVKNNRMRKPKRLWTEREMGEKIVLMEACDEYGEALKIVEKIQYEISNYKRNFKDFAILYRTNAQSRALEDALRRHAISYVIVGGIRFYERKEVKDFLAYLKVIANPADSISLLRAISFPPRGIGEVTIHHLQQFASEKNIPLLEAMKRVDEISNIGSAMKERVRQVYEWFAKYQHLKKELGMNELSRVLNDDVGFLRMYKEEGTIEAMNRYDNIQELLAAISEFAQTRTKPTLETFLEEVSLITDIDTWDDKANAVTLMTLHSAKGLEFPVVFIAGLEDGLFPLSRNMDDPEAFEEERRLFYVGITRAKEKLYLSWAQNRRRYMDGYQNVVSQFIKEIDPELIEYEVTPQYYGRRRRPKWEEVEQEMPANEDYIQDEVRLYVGGHVRHPEFGRGVILKIEGSGLDSKITVFFDNIGQKKLLLRYAHLEIL